LSTYVGTYKKYNKGSLFGEWLNLSDYSDYNELIEAVKELHNDEEDPEFMFQDYEHCELFAKLGLVGENYIFKDIYEIAGQIKDSGYNIEIFEAYIDCVGRMDFRGVYDGVINNYIGEYSDDETFDQYLLEESIPDSLPSFIYIDWEATARSLMYDHFESNGHYFKS
jgi:antirestriction protein